MKIELLYFEGCPGHEPTLNLLEKVLEEEGINSSIEQINVNSNDLVQRYRFLGSPSIRVDGKDIEIETHASNDFGQKCRIYDDGGVPIGVPPIALVRDAITKAKGNHSCCG